MSSAPNNSAPLREAKPVSSITRRLAGGRLARGFWRLLLSLFMWLLMIPAAYLAVREHSLWEHISFKTERHLTLNRNEAGRIRNLEYRAVNPEGVELDIDLWPLLKPYLMICTLCFVLRLLSLLFSYGAERKRVRTLLAPLNALALRAEELSRMSFGEEKYQMIEDAVTRLEAAEDARLTLGDRDLAGVEAAINNLLTRVRESNRQQARFVNDASHELRTPIAVIGGYADMLERWGKNDEKVLNESIAAIRTETERMKHLVEQLLFLARGDAGRTRLTPEAVSLNTLMREAYEESLMIDENHRYRLKEAQPDISIQADQALLKQAVRILLDNAAKYTAAGDEILLAVGEDGGRPYLEVQDTGIGMARADMEHMFERFYRADQARSVEGTGLGLSIAKWIVDKHGGHFEILSRESLGTRIRIIL